MKKESTTAPVSYTHLDVYKRQRHEGYVEQERRSIVALAQPLEAAVSFPMRAGDVFGRGHGGESAIGLAFGRNIKGGGTDEAALIGGAQQLQGCLVALDEPAAFQQEDWVRRALEEFAEGVFAFPQRRLRSLVFGNIARGGVDIYRFPE